MALGEAMTEKPSAFKIYIPRIPATWWLRNRRYFLFMMRELSSLFIAIFLILCLIQIAMVARGREAYESLIQTLYSPRLVGLYLVILVFALLHSITWFNLTSQILILRISGRIVPPMFVKVGGFAAWIIISIMIALFLA